MPAPPNQAKVFDLPPRRTRRIVRDRQDWYESIAMPLISPLPEASERFSSQSFVYTVKDPYPAVTSQANITFQFFGVDIRPPVTPVDWPLPKRQAIRRQPLDPQNLLSSTLGAMAPFTPYNWPIPRRVGRRLVYDIQITTVAAPPVSITPSPVTLSLLNVAPTVVRTLAPSPLVLSLLVQTMTLIRTLKPATITLNLTIIQPIISRFILTVAQLLFQFPAVKRNLVIKPAPLVLTLNIGAPLLRHRTFSPNAEACGENDRGEGYASPA